jgi:hypothetical protein
MTDLPNPLAPADCDCAAAPVPFDMLVELLISTFGFSAETAAATVLAMASDLPFAISEGGRA